MMDLQPMEEGSASVEVHLHPHLAPLEDKMFSGGIYLSLCACTHMTLLACSHPHGMYNVGASHPVQLPSSVDVGLIVSHSKSFMAIRHRGRPVPCWCSHVALDCIGSQA